MLPATAKYLAVCLALGASPCLAQTKPLWSIYWMSDKLPCGTEYWNKPMTSAAQPCGPISGAAISICPRPKIYPYPYDQGKKITIVGYQITQILTVPTAGGYMVVGSGHGGDAADIFAMTGGIGTHSDTLFFPPGIGIPQGLRADDRPSDYAHIDVYGACDQGQQQALINIFYTSP